MFSGLVVDLADELGVDFIVKGLRAASDFEVELQMAQMNYAVSGVHTVFLPSTSSHSFLASKFLRDMARFGRDVSSMVPPAGREAAAGEVRAMTTNHDDNDTGEHPVPRLSDSEALLRRVADIISSAKTMPLSSSAMINRDEILELLEEANNRLPEELRAARWLLRERDEFLAKTRREGDDILDAARAQAERMVQRTEVVRAAEHRARQVVTSAEDESRRLRHEVEDYCDQRLAQFEVVLDKVLRTVQAGRERLAPTGLPEPEEAEAEAAAAHEAVFFDQDQS